MFRGAAQWTGRSIYKLCPLRFQVAHPIEQNECVLQLTGKLLEQAALPCQFRLLGNQARALFFKYGHVLQKRGQSLPGFSHPSQHFSKAKQTVLPA